jgi:hypothetical protein
MQAGLLQEARPLRQEALKEGASTGAEGQEVRPRILLVLAVCATALLVLAMPAFSASPWWHLRTQVLPTDLHSGVARETKFKLEYKEATKGEVLVEDPNHSSEVIKQLIEIKNGERTRAQLTFAAFLPFNAKAATVQEALEKQVYPANRVNVKGEAGSYEIVFPGQVAENLNPEGKPSSAYGYIEHAPPFVAVQANGSIAAFVGGERLENEKGNEVTPTVIKAANGRPDGQIVVTATNLGDAPADGETGSPVTLAYRLPPGVEAVSVVGGARTWTSVANSLECSLKPAAEPLAPACTFNGKLAPYNSVTLVLSVVDVGAQPGATGEAMVSGGGAHPVSQPHKVTVGEATPFGVEDYELVNETEGGAPDTQAGSHPFQQTTTISLNQTVNLGNGVVQAAQLPRDLHFRWPAGLVGNATAIPQCTLPQFEQEGHCPPQTAVGVTNTLVSTFGPFGSERVVQDFAEPLFNLVPAPGEPARFGFKPGLPVYIDPSVRSGKDYGVTVSSENITEIANLLSVQVTVWGTPGEASHDAFRGFECVHVNQGLSGTCEPLKVEHPSAFLSLPTSCTGPSHSEVYGDSWAESKPASLQPLLASFEMPALDGCDALPFNPQLRLTPDGQQASTPTGLNVDVHVPQQETLNPGGLAEADPRNITVALPQGVAVNPSSGDGLQACSEGLVGFQGLDESINPSSSTAIFKPFLPGNIAAKTAVEAGDAPASESTFEQGVNFCADASKIGTVTIRTPVLPPTQPLKGAVYIATQNQNPFGSLIAIYLVAEDPVSGILVRQAGEVHLTETGRLVTTIHNIPQAPFEDAELHFFGGERAPLASPARCGAYTATGSLTPWSQQPGEPPRISSSTFSITSGPNHAPCPGPSLPFHPSLAAQSTDIQAGGFTPFTTTIGREDGDQDMQSVQLHMPPGVSGLLSNVKLCSEAQANEGTCGPESLIGETTVSAGVGSDPVSVKGGRVYLTEKYAGAPFGLSIVNPVKAGPFDLERDTSNPAQNPPCDCVVVRAKIEVDPHTAALTVTTDPSGPHAIPRMIDGIPVQIKHVYVAINREHFTFNPTNCNPLQITGSIAGDEGASQPLSVPFQATNCAVLKFSPEFSVSTSGKTSKAKGASLSVKLSYPNEPFGSQANIASVKVELPKQLPSRLTTLQKACTAAQFASNPAGCPAASIVGHAIVHTPLLPVPLEGPAYFVSNGGEAFPNLIMVLQGYGVTVDLVGDTFINKAGITSSTFKSTPDVPFTTFELNLPEGPHSALAANTNLCAHTKTKTIKKRITIHRRDHTLHLTRRVRALIPQSLVMPTTIRAQNGAQIKQNTKITITNCPHTRHGKHAKKATHRHHHKA